MGLILEELKISMNLPTVMFGRKNLETKMTLRNMWELFMKKLFHNLGVSFDENVFLSGEMILMGNKKKGRENKNK